MSEKIIVRDLSKSFEGRKSSTLALDCVNLTLVDGEFLCIVGPSGCGKTTILRIIAGLEDPSSGTITVNRSGAGGQPLNAMVFQEQSLLPWLTVIDNVAFGLEMRGIGRRERYDRAQPYLEMVGLTRFRDYYPRQLSGGMKQRVSLARAFANDPEILLMDEPFVAQFHERGQAFPFRRAADHFRKTPLEISVILVNQEWMDGNFKLAGEFTVAYFKGLRYVYDAMMGGNNRSEVIDIVSRHTGVNDKAIFDRMQWSYMDPNGRVARDSLRDQQAWHARQGSIPKEVGIDEIVDDRLVKYAVGQLGVAPEKRP